MNKKQHRWSFKQSESESATGPLEEAKFVALVKNGTIQASTLVNSPTRTKNKWVAAKRIPALEKLFKPSKVENVAAAPAKPKENPCVAPASDAVAPVSRIQTKAEKDIYEKFQPLKSTVLVWLLRATILVMAIDGFLFWCFFEYGRSNSPSLATAQIGVFIVQLILVIATAIFFLRWKYQAYKNLQVACSSKLKTTAGWSIGCYFIPLLNIFRPAMAMHEIQSRSKAKIGYTVLAWWILLAWGGILDRVASTAPGDDNRAGHFVTIVGFCLLIIAGFLLLKIIRTVTEKQRRYRVSLDPNSR